MCGIAGGFAFGAAAPVVDVRVVEAINRRQFRRGPDGGGVWGSDDGRIVLGHRRLAIIDTSESGAQPMTEAGGRWTCVFNGEIYNYRELRDELEGLGYRFVSSSDTEALLNAIDAWGEAALCRLRGMYAFAIWDSESEELWLARDPFGIKPLYWSACGASLYFASSARALSDCAPVDASRDPAGLVGFYLWGFVPEPFTWWEGVHALPAGGLLRISRGALEVPAPRLDSRIADAFHSPAQAIEPEELRRALGDSVARHFVSDAPVGVFLSAGIDSTVIAALAAQAGFRLRTLTLAFDEFAGLPGDEAPLAEETARLIGAEHTTVRVSRAEFLDLLDDFLDDMDQPTTDGLNAYLVSRAAASIGLKVALSGIGGDELFGGYPSFTQIPRALRLFDFRGRETVGKALQALGAPLCHALGVNPKFAAVVNYSGSPERAYLLRRCLHLPEELELLLDESWLRRGWARLAAASENQETTGSAHADISRRELAYYMRNQPLRDADWAGMAHSVEVRTPLLDMPLLSRLAPAILSANPPGKADLARCAGPVATRLIDRPKTGFTTPVSHWLPSRKPRRRGMQSWALKVAAHYRARPEGDSCATSCQVS